MGVYVGIHTSSFNSSATNCMEEKKKKKSKVISGTQKRAAIKNVAPNDFDSKEVGSQLLLLDESRHELAGWLARSLARWHIFCQFCSVQSALLLLFTFFTRYYTESARLNESGGRTILCTSYFARRTWRQWFLYISLFLPPSVRWEVKGLSELLSRHYSDILIFWKIFKVRPKYWP